MPDGSTTILSENDVVYGIRNGNINIQTMYWAEGMAEWAPLVSKYAQYNPLPAPPAQLPSLPAQLDRSPKGVITTVAKRNLIWLSLCLGIVAIFISATILTILDENLPFPIPSLIAAIIPFIIWLALVDKIKQYRNYTGISYPATYIVLFFFCFLPVIGPFLLMILFLIKIGKIPAYKNNY